MAPKVFRADDNEVVVVGGNRANETVVNLSKNNKSRKSIYIPNIRAIVKSNFLTSNAKKTFNHLQLVFIKVPILQHFDLKSYIRIETDISSYTINRILSQLKLDSNVPSNDLNLNQSNFGQWYSVVHFSRKIIFIET